MFCSIAIQFTLIVSSFALCPPFESMPNLDLKKYGVNWYVHGVISTFDDLLKLQCTHLNISSNDWTSEPVKAFVSVHARLIDFNLDFKRTFAVQIQNLKQPGKWTVQIINSKFEYWVVDADNDYSLSIGCLSSGQADTQNLIVALIKSTSFSPIPQTIIDKYKSIVAAYNLDTSNYNIVQQNEQLCSLQH